MSRYSLLLVALPFLAGCQRATSPDAAFTIRDSLGTEIVEIPFPPLDSVPEWDLSSTPVVSIGEMEAVLSG